MNPPETYRALSGSPGPEIRSPGAGDMASAPAKLRVLVVDDEPTIRGVIAQVLRLDGHDVTEAARAEDALVLFREAPFSLVITDVVMGQMSGLDLLREIRAMDPEAIVVIMTSQASLEIATSALRDGAYDFLTKPFEELVLVSALAARANDRIQLQSRNRLLVEQLKTYARELERLNAQLREVADRDGLTGLFNYRYLRDALEAEVAAAVARDRRVSLMLLDVDHFKLYNDTHGHLAGDEVLRELGRILQDEGGPGSVCARYGGEEFAVILPNVDRPAAMVRGECLRRRIEKHAFVIGTSSGEGVTISLGVSCCPEDGDQGHTLIDRADEALYRAKLAGRNLVCG